MGDRATSPRRSKMADYYGRIEEFKGKRMLLGLGRVWPEKGMREEIYDGARWIEAPFLGAIYGEDFDADWGPLPEALVKELAKPGVIDGGIMAER